MESTKPQATPAPRPEEPHKLMSSYEVFMQFVEHGENNEVFADKVFSTDCFKLWVQTRKDKLQHPEDSFRRTLTAHLRGMDGRKPFEEPVEAALLALLRQPTSSKADDGSKKPTYVRSVWERCFQDTTRRIGCRGFKKKGWHENNRYETQQQQKQQQQQQQPTPPLMKTELTKCNGFGECTSMVCRKRERDLQYPHLESNVHTNKDRTLPDPLKEMLVRSIDSPGCYGPNIQGFARVMSQCYTYVQMHNFCKNTTEAGVGILSPSFLFMMNQTDPNDRRLSKEHLLVSKREEQHFLPGRPVGRVLLDRVASRFVESDLNAIEILHMNLAGVSIFNFTSSMVQTCRMLQFFLPVIVKESVVWLRWRVLRGDGTEALILARLERVSSKMDMVSFQDHSDLYLDHLRLPFFA